MTTIAAVASAMSVAVRKTVGMQHLAHPRGQAEADLDGSVKDDEDRATSSGL